MTETSIPNNPLIMVNREFVRLSGYSKGEIIGANCRFLQGPESEIDKMRELTHSIRHKKDCHLELTNYRKNGELFENLLTMRYINDSLGRRRFCVGLQLDLTGLSSDDGPWGQRRLATQSGRELIAEASQKMLKLITMIPKVLQVPTPHSSPPPSPSASGPQRT